MFTTDQRLKLQELLEQTLGSNKVYFQPGSNANISTQYPCIVYHVDNARTEFAGNLPYKYTKRYQVTVIHRDPDDATPDKVATLPMCLFDRTYVANNLHHSVFTLYF